MANRSDKKRPRGDISGHSTRGNQPERAYVDIPPQVYSQTYHPSNTLVLGWSVADLIILFIYLVRPGIRAPFLHCITDERVEQARGRMSRQSDLPPPQGRNHACRLLPPLACLDEFRVPGVQQLQSCEAQKLERPCRAEQSV
ncbi:hypothetical protein RRG08_012957 [Elysia crispata]|uniref:Uncharacterized protein n=1 Tax=Elysia crispata TaxID=231223 RepID=A0AAE0ZZX5_9GAST|nr:hypothetical protein RRG08_012957 [Elysia crispata]